MKLTPLGLYIHIPYCLQRCLYCDFSTVLWNHKLPPNRYFNLLNQELQLRQSWLHEHEVRTIYFGGGTPSLVDCELIISFLDQLSKNGVKLKQVEEVTLEIDPGTPGVTKIKDFQAAGVTRFSVGLQTFNDVLLRKVGRRHSSEDSRRLLNTLRGLNYTADILFSLPQQTTLDLAQDIDELLRWDPPHVSAYYLTIDPENPLQKGRPNDDVDVELFNCLERKLAENGLHRYEISNFAKPGHESRHNMIYWTDAAYLGLGMSAHSYDPRAKPYGVRFQNQNDIHDYEKQITKGELWSQNETLSLAEAMTDFCHISLRRTDGLLETSFVEKFGRPLFEELIRRRDRLIKKGLAEITPNGFRLTSEGRRLANQAFLETTFVAEELPKPADTVGNPLSS